MKKRTLFIIIGSIAFVLLISIGTVAVLKFIQPTRQDSSDQTGQDTSPKPNEEYVEEVIQEDGTKVPFVKVRPPSP